MIDEVFEDHCAKIDKAIADYRKVGRSRRLGRNLDIFATVILWSLCLTAFIFLLK